MNPFRKLANWLSYQEPKIVQLTNTVVAVKGKDGLKHDSGFNIYIPSLREHDWLFSVPAKTYIAYKAKLRNLSNSDENYWNYVTPKEASLYEIVTALTSKSLGSKWRIQQKEVADLVVDFVHRIPYQERESYVKYPIETLCEFGGNCIDLSVLGASMLKIAEIESCFVATEDHVFLGVNIEGSGHYVEQGGKKYYTVEMTGTNFPSKPNQDRIGEMNDFKLEEAVIQTKK